MMMIPPETYTLSYNPIFSLPIRMPGIALSIFCSDPTFQLALKGGCDESCIFEMNQSKHMWKITPMNFALGRLAYDIIWEDGLVTDEIVQLRISYAAVLKNMQDQSLAQTIESRSWNLDFRPQRWVMLPKSRRLVSKIRVEFSTSPPPPSPQCPLPPSSPSPPPSPPSSPSSPFAEYQIAIATIPLKLIECQSVGGILDFSLVHNNLSITDHKLNFSQVFGTWLVFNQPVDWQKYTIQVTYY